MISLAAHSIHAYTLILFHNSSQLCQVRKVGVRISAYIYYAMSFRRRANRHCFSCAYLPRTYIVKMNSTTSVLNAEQIRALLDVPNLPAELVHEALTAAGVDPNIPDGFKTLAQIGTSLIDTLIAKIGHKASKSTTTRGMLKNQEKKKAF